MNSRYRPPRSRKLSLATGATTVLTLSALSPVQAQQDTVSRQSQPVSAAVQVLARNEGPPAGPNGSVSEVVVSSNHSGDVEGALQEQLQSVGVNNVLSVEQIEQAPVSSVADLSTLIPGLAQHRDQFLGQAATGEGQYISIRGFDTAYNAYSLNGMRLAQTDAASRAVSLNLFSPFGLSSIKVDKAPTPDEDGDSIAGILDLRTPSAFNFSGQHFLVRTQGQLAEQALDTGQAAAGGAMQLEYANRLDSEGRWGVFVSGYFQNKDSTAEEVGAQNSPVLNNDLLNGTPRDNSNNLVMNGEQWNFYREQIRRFGGNLSLDYNGDGTSLYWRTLFAHYTNDMNQDQQSLRTSSVTGQLPPAANNQSDGLPGLNPDPGISGTEYNAASGNFSPYGIQPGHYWQYNQFQQKLFNTQLGGETRLQSLPLTLDYAAGYSHGEYAKTQHYEAGQWGAPYIDSVAGNGPGVATEGLSFDPSNPARPIPVVSPGAAAYLYNPNSTRAWSIDYWNNYSHEGLMTLREDTSWALQRGWLDSLKVGFKYERALRNSDDSGDQADQRVYVGLPGVVQGTPEQPQFYQGQGPTTAAFPGSFLNSFMGGTYRGPFKLVSLNAYKSLWASLEAANPVNQSAAEQAYAESRIDGTEQRYAGYLEAVLKYGNLLVLPGVRYELNKDRFTSFQQDTIGGEYVTNSKSLSEWLPGISATWRPDDSDVYRASVRKSYARPAFDQLYGASSVTVDVDGNVTINEPNPSLKPIESVNYDVGFEHYDHQGGVLQIDGYYKDLRNVIFAAGATNASTDITNNVTTIAGTTTINTTLNGLSGHAYGVELNARKRLPFLPAPYDGFGVGGNLTAQHSQANYAISPTDIRSAQLPNAPNLMYNLELFYDKYSFKAALDYSYQGLALEEIQETDPDIYTQPVKTLNLSTTYQFPFGLKVGFAIQNLMNASTYWATYGKSTHLLAQGANNEGGFVETGRIFLLNMSYEL